MKHYQVKLIFHHLDALHQADAPIQHCINSLFGGILSIFILAGLDI
jgi:hypothetical protein